MAHDADNPAAPPDEAQLIARGQNGDAFAFNALVERYERLVYAVCFRMLDDAEAAADVAQDTFLAAYRNIRRFHGGSFKAWLMRIATNACYDQLRARKRRQHVSLDAVDWNEESPQPQWTDPGEAPDERVLRAELAAQIQRLLQDLPEDQRLAVVLSDIQGHSYEEIASTTGWPLETVKSRLSRGRIRLRDALRAADMFPAAAASTRRVTERQQGTLV